MIRGISEALRGANGGIELNRFVGFLGGLFYIIGAHVFVAWELILGREFDLATYCVVFPAGVAGLASGTALAVSIKDKAVASAKVTEQSATPIGPRVPVDDPDRQPVPGEYGHDR